MKRVFAGTFVAAAFAVSLAAQSAPPQSQPAQEAKEGGSKNVTVTGCLKAGDSADSFTLSDLKWGQDKAVGTSGTPGAPATPPIAATNLKLTGSKQLSEHVGHTVEVSGTIGDKADKPMGSPDPGARPAPAAGAQASLNVRNVKMISQTCTP